MNRRLFLLLGIAILVVITSWLIQLEERPDTTGDSGAKVPDYFIKGFSSIHTDEQGNTNQQLVAITLYHYPDNDRTALEQPDITITNDDGSRWHATANSGELYGGKQRTLMLRDNVVLRQLGDDSLTLYTDWLSIDGERRYAETDAPVRVESVLGNIEGIGMNLYGEEQRLLVRSAVRGHYEAR